MLIWFLSLWGRNSLGGGWYCPQSQLLEIWWGGFLIITVTGFALVFSAVKSHLTPKNVKAVPETSRKHHKDFPLLSMNHEGETEEGFRAQAEISWLGATTSKGTTPSGKAEHGNTERHGRCGIGQVKRQHKGSFHHNASVLWRESEYMWIPLDLA